MIKKCKLLENVILFQSKYNIYKYYERLSLTKLYRFQFLIQNCIENQKRSWLKGQKRIGPFVKLAIER